MRDGKPCQKGSPAVCGRKRPARRGYGCSRKLAVFRIQRAHKSPNGGNSAEALFNAAVLENFNSGGGRFYAAFHIKWHAF